MLHYDANRNNRSQAVLAACAALLLTLGCGRSDTASAVPETVESSALGLRLTDPGPPWTLESRSPERWVMTDVSGGTMTVHLGPIEEQTPNIVEAVRSRLAEFDAMQGGESFGNQQLQAPIGLIYTARGSYSDPQDAAASVGELTAYTVHPHGGRLLILTYTYPGGGDPKARYDNLLSLLGSLEPLPAPGAPGDAG